MNEPISNPFKPNEPLEPDQDPLYIVPSGIEAISNDLIARECCLLIGVPGCGTSTMLLAARNSYLAQMPNAEWWTIDLASLPNKDSYKLFQALGKEGLARFPNQDHHWKQVKDDRAFCQALVKSMLALKVPLILAIDHIEVVPRNVAKKVVRGVRSLYTNWNIDTTYARLVSVVLAGSHELYRQAADHGSPLNFAISHEVLDLSQEETYCLLMRAGAQYGWHFAPEAAEYLASMTNGDKYLTHRLGYACVELLQIDDTNICITLAMAQSIVNDFCTVGYTQDPRFSKVISDLVEDEDVLSFFLRFVDDPDHSIDYLELMGADFSLNLKRLFRIEHNQISIRNPICQRILTIKQQIIHSTHKIHKQYRSKLLREQRLHELSNRLELSPDNEDTLQDLLKEIRIITEADDDIHLVVYDSDQCQYRLHVSSSTEKGKEIFLPDRDGEIRRRLLRAEGELPCQSQKMCIECLGKRGDNCTWIPLNSIARKKQIGAIVLRGKSWAFSNSRKRDLDNLSQILTFAIQRWQQQQGLRQLTHLSANELEKTDIYKAICRATATIFNADGVCVWEGRTHEKHLESRNSIGCTNSYQSIESDFVKRFLQQEKGTSVIIQLLDKNESEIPPLIVGMMKENLLLSVLMIGFQYGNNDKRLGLIGIGFHEHWRFNSIEQTLADLLGKQITTILDNRRLLKRAEQRVRASQSAVHLLSHELNRQPARISREMELFLEGRLGKITENQVAALHRIQDWIDAHQELTDRLLNVPRLEAGNLPVKKSMQPITPIVEATLIEFKDEIAESQMSIKSEFCDVQLLHEVDRILVMVVIRDLIRNSIQYAKTGTIKVSVDSIDDITLVHVEDHGPGVSPEHRKNIFERYNRGQFTETRKGRPGNLGLGLHFVWEIMNLHGGGVEYDEDFTKGARFKLTFPFGARK